MGLIQQLLSAFQFQHLLLDDTLCIIDFLNTGFIVRDAVNKMCRYSLLSATILFRSLMILTKFTLEFAPIRVKLFLSNLKLLVVQILELLLAG